MKKERAFDQKEEGMTREQVEGALDKIRPTLVADGGNVELVNINDGTVEVRLTGACGG